MPLPCPSHPTFPCPCHANARGHVEYGYYRGGPCSRGTWRFGTGPANGLAAVDIDRELARIPVRSARGRGAWLAVYKIGNDGGQGPRSEF